MVNVAYARWIGRRIYRAFAATVWIRVTDEAEARRVLGLEDSPAAGGADIDGSSLPSAVRAFAPVVVPLLLIFASITAPILATTDVNPAIAAQAAALGAMVFSYFNDSCFWVVNRLLGIDEVEEQVRVWSLPTTIAWAVSAVLVMALSFLVPR